MATSDIFIFLFLFFLFSPLTCVENEGADSMPQTQALNKDLIPSLVQNAKAHTLKTVMNQDRKQQRPKTTDVGEEKFIRESPAKQSKDTTSAKQSLLKNEEFKRLIEYLHLEKEIDEIFELLNTIRFKVLQNAKKEYCFVSSQHVLRRLNALVSFNGNGNVFGLNTIFGTVTQFFDDGCKNDGSCKETTKRRTDSTTFRTTAASDSTTIHFERKQWVPARLDNFTNLSDAAVKSGIDEINQPYWVARFTVVDNSQTFQYPGNIKMGNVNTGQPAVASHVASGYTTANEFEVLVAPLHKVEWIPVTKGNHKDPSERRNWVLAGQSSAYSYYVGRCVNKDLKYKDIPGALYVYTTGVYIVYVAHDKKYSSCNTEMEVLKIETSLV